MASDGPDSTYFSNILWMFSFANTASSDANDVFYSILFLNFFSWERRDWSFFPIWQCCSVVIRIHQSNWLCPVLHLQNLGTSLPMLQGNWQWLQMSMSYHWIGIPMQSHESWGSLYFVVLWRYCFQWLYLGDTQYLLDQTILVGKEGEGRLL